MPVVTIGDNTADDFTGCEDTGLWDSNPQFPDGYFAEYFPDGYWPEYGTLVFNRGDITHNVTVQANISHDVTLQSDISHAVTVQANITHTVDEIDG